MNEKEINQEIKRLKSKLTGELFADMKTQQEIYELKILLKPEIIKNPDMDEDDECLSCGS
jgi:hypothetical protein